MGIAKALNQICQRGYDDGYRWVVTLDQDTICPDNLVSQLSKYKNKDIGIVCPAVSYEGLGIKTHRGNKECDFVYACMTSSSLTNLNGWKEVGGFKESYFIDFVDNEFCMKLSLKGYKIMRTFACEIQHQLGSTREIRIFGRKYRGTSHSMIRCYYMMRNNVLFIREYSQYLNTPKEYVKLIYVAWGEFLYSSRKCETLKYLWRGIVDGFKGKEGPYGA
jgi:rhamnosyltransferase